MARLMWLCLIGSFLAILPGCQIPLIGLPLPPLHIVIVLPDTTDALSSPQQQTEPLFTDVADAAGARLSHIGDAPVMPLGGGVAFGDYDNDGWLDMYVTNQGGPNALYHNQGASSGQPTFVDEADFAEVTVPDAIGSGTLFGDYDNDGWRDLYVVNLGLNLLFRNNGDGTFSDVTANAGVGDKALANRPFGATTTATVGSIVV